MRKNIVAGNWKMNNDLAATKTLISELIKLNWLIRYNSKIYVSQEWRKKNLENNEIILKELIELSTKI